MITLGNNIKQLRGKNNMSQIDLAKELKVSQTSIAHYEAGTRQPSIETLVKIASLFQVTVDSLVGALNTSQKEPDMEVDEVIESLIECLLNGNSDEFWNMVDMLENSFTLLTIFDYILKPVLYKTGNMWEQGVISEVEEHYISGMIQKSIAYLGNKNKEVIKTEKATSFVIGSDKHTIGLEMVNAYVESKGIEVHSIGSDLPDQSVHSFIEKLNPDYLIISMTLESYTNNLLRFLNMLKKDLKVFIGGQGITDKNLFSDFTNVYVINKLEELPL